MKRIRFGMWCEARAQWEKKYASAKQSIFHTGDVYEVNDIKNACFPVANFEMDLYLKMK